MAGNGNAALTDKLEADDRIAPTLTVNGISGDVETDGRPLAQEEITVTLRPANGCVGAAGMVGEFDRWQDHNGTVRRRRGRFVGEFDGTNAWEGHSTETSDETKVAAIIVRGCGPMNNNFVTGLVGRRRRTAGE